MSKVKLRDPEMGTKSENNLSPRIPLSGHNWLHITNTCLPHRAPFWVLPMEWKKRRGGQQMKWQRAMRKCTTNLGTVGLYYLRDWYPKDPAPSWMQSLLDRGRGERTVNSGNHAIIFSRIRMIEMFVAAVRLYPVDWLRLHFFFPTRLESLSGHLAHLCDV